MNRKTPILFLLCILGISVFGQNKASVLEKIAIQQNSAYNDHDLDEYLSFFSQDVEIYNFPNELKSRGKGALEEFYAQMFVQLPDLSWDSKKTIVMGNKLIDHATITFQKEKAPTEIVALYEFESLKIKKVFFFYPD